ncbi:hypothetical protein HZB69_00180 [Candidatus Amesbacteria bacterium]|nr:hypothetical protein [Candidatus Amesbacteria bacterium]
MESIPARETIKRLKVAKISLFTPTTLQQILNNQNYNTIHKTLMRLESQELIIRLGKGKYRLSDSTVSSFTVGNFLLQPSYISLETALNLYGILSQFPYISTSITPLKSRKVNTQGIDYEYVHVDKSLFWGYIKTDDYLIANPEKAIIDTLYLASKGLRGANYNEWDLERINKPRLISYAQKVRYNPFQKLFAKLLLI